MDIAFFKMTASGNDFIVIDARENDFLPSKEFIQKMCRRKDGMGADGVLVLKNCHGADVFMRIFNADGTEAEMCGNGARCIGYLSSILSLPQTLTIKTKAGIVKVEKQIDGAKVFFFPPKDIRLWRRVELNGECLTFHTLNTGVPHAVFFVEELEELNVEEKGRRIRHLEIFSPEGTNVNFIKPIHPHALSIRTYERGVEAETLSCGTGSIAASCVTYLLGFCSPPIEVKARKEILYVEFDEDFSSLSLSGRVNLLYKGVLEV